MSVMVILSTTDAVQLLSLSCDDDFLLLASDLGMNANGLVMRKRTVLLLVRARQVTWLSTHYHGAAFLALAEEARLFLHTLPNDVGSVNHGVLRSRWPRWMKQAKGLRSGLRCAIF